MTSSQQQYPSYVTSVEWPETNPLNLTVEQDGQQIPLMTYRYPVEASLRKGVVFYVHGFGAYSEKTAFIFKNLADRGYEVIAMD